MKIYLGTDHAGYDLKEQIKIFLEDSFDFEVIDLGANSFDEMDDYPDFIKLVAQAVVGDVGNLGIIFGGSGQGEAMVANREKGVRCAVYYGGSKDIIKLSRQHNDANMLSIGARFVEVNDAKESIRLWLNTEFSNDDRHKRRIKKIDE
jgi:ribose 5-phosphate isomerase B